MVKNPKVRCAYQTLEWVGHYLNQVWAMPNIQMSQHLFVRGIDPIDGVLPGQNPMGFPQLWPTAIDGFWNYLVMGRSSQKKIGALKL